MDLPKLKLLRSVKTGKGLVKLITSLRHHRRKNKSPSKRRALSKQQREFVLSKTDSRCHVCGIELDADHFQADHVKSHISGGVHVESNYLPSCLICNNLRWHYSAEEIQLMMKMGRWMKTKLLEETEGSLQMANEFMKHEMKLRKNRRRNSLSQ